MYVIQGLKDNKFYTGYTNNLERRIEEHNKKTQFSTSHRGPFKLVYYEACVTKGDAVAREKYLKSGWGKKYLKNRTRKSLRDNLRAIFSG